MLNQSGYTCTIDYGTGPSYTNLVYRDTSSTLNQTTTITLSQKIRKNVTYYYIVSAESSSRCVRVWGRFRAGRYIVFRTKTLLCCHSQEAHRTKSRFRVQILRNMLITNWLTTVGESHWIIGFPMHLSNKYFLHGIYYLHVHQLSYDFIWHFATKHNIFHYLKSAIHPERDKVDCSNWCEIKQMRHIGSIKPVDFSGYM